MGQLAMCSDCMGRGGNQQGGNGQYSYEVFRKVPFFGSISNYLRMIKGGGGGGGPMAMISQFGNMAGINIPGMGPSGPSSDFGPPGFNPQGYGPSGFNVPGQIMPGGGGQAPPGPGSFFNNLNIMNLLPVGTGGDKDSVFDLVKKDTFVRKIKKSNYKELLTSLESNGEQFTDPDFPPNATSLGDLASHGTDPSQITWQRVPDIINNPMFIKDQIEPSDILQGQLGDCYFLSALSTLAQQGFRIKNLFPSLEINKHGIYMARILFNGEYQEVVIDDYFPVGANKKVHFAQPAGNQEIWVMVLEKCWAKMYGSFANIIGGLPNEVLHAFSSAPVYFHPISSDPSKQEILWQQMLRDDKNGGLLACGTKADDSIEQFGFVKGHAYTILGVYDKPMRLIKMRNPWGHKEWRGRASDYDTQFWNQVSATDKQLLDYEDSSRKTEKDGIFFVCWQDFLKYFQLVDICKINDNSTYNFVTTQFEHLAPKMYQFQVKSPQPSLMTIAVTQPSKRGTQNRLSRNYAALGKWCETTNRYKYVTSKSGKNFPDNFLEIEKAEPGKYMLYTKYLWSQGKSTGDAVVSVYSLSPATIAEGQGIASDQFLRQIMYDHASRNQRKKTLPGTNDWICSDILLNEGGFSYFVANPEGGSTSKYGVTLNESQYTDNRLVLVPPHKGCQVLRKQVVGGKPLIVVAELLSENFPGSITNPTPKVETLQ